jgi:hypothetical protein
MVVAMLMIKILSQDFSMPGAVFRALCELTHLILVTTLPDRHYYNSHIAYEETEAQRGAICLSSHSEEV